VNTETRPSPAFWFGGHKGKTPAEIEDSSYLVWVMQAMEKMPRKLRLAVAAELQRRGVAVPAPQPSKPLPPCPRCRGTEMRHSWQEDRTGRRLIRRECARCSGWCGFAPQTPANVAEADRNANQTPALDALVLAADENVELLSDGAQTYLGRGWDRASPQLQDAVRQCGHRLASLLGRTERGGRQP
jgi:hypothetical protein